MRNNTGQQRFYAYLERAVKVGFVCEPDLDVAEMASESPTPARDYVLSGDEQDILSHVVQVYLSDLRMEIVGTDNPGMRRALRHEEEVLKMFQAKLADPTPGS